MTTFLLLFSIILGFYLWYTFCIVYHFIRFGVGTNPKTLSLIFFVGSFVLFIIAVLAFLNINRQGIFSASILP